MELQERLKRGDVIIMDGGTGTEMERRGAPMIEKGWCAHSTLTHPEILRQIHEDYIRAGADIVITNTFATSRHVLEACGLSDKFEAINAAAARIACEVRDHVAERPVYVAGSIATTTFGAEQPPAAEAEANFSHQAEMLAEGGVDFLILEMMRDIDYTSIVLKAAKRTGLPVWLGYSTKITEAGQVTLLTRGIPLSEALQALSADDVSVVSIMHTLTEDIDPSLDILTTHWSGPMGVYAHSGAFKIPHWQFDDVISPADYAAKAVTWAGQGVQIIGGCCGIGPAHIEVLKAQLGS
jgi:homocysteine S-methyltransferase